MYEFLKCVDEVSNHSELCKTDINFPASGSRILMRRSGAKADINPNPHFLTIVLFHISKGGNNLFSINVYYSLLDYSVFMFASFKYLPQSLTKECLNVFVALLLAKLNSDKL